MTSAVRSSVTTGGGENAAYVERRAWIAEYFDRTAAEAWAQLTSDAPVSAVRRSVRAARDKMRSTLSGWLPTNLAGLRVLDAGCGTGALSIELANRGAQVVAIDLSPTLVALARERTPPALSGRIEFHAGDMLEPGFGSFDYTVAMDSIIHYRVSEMIDVVRALLPRTRKGVLFTVVPRTPLLTVMHSVGRAFPRASRAPAIEPVSERELRNGMQQFADSGWRIARSERVQGGFYTSQAIEFLPEETAP